MIDYSEWLDTGETLLTADFTVDPLGALTVDGVGVVGSNVVFFVNGGDDQVTYKVLVTITTSAGQTKEDSILFVVRNP
jgi:hypothetical protein